VLAGLTIRNPTRARSAHSTPPGLYCALDAPPLRNLEAVPVTVPAEPEGQT
jgi:hypothetical protein